MERRRCLSCNKNVYSAATDGIWQCPNCRTHIPEEGSRVGEIYILIEHLKLKEITKRELRLWATKRHEGKSGSRENLWGMAKALQLEGLIEQKDFERLARFAWKK
jgi:hypothetical protein